MNKQRVVLVKSPKKNATLQFCSYDCMPPGMQYLGMYKNKRPMYGFGEASPKWRKLQCS